MCFIHAAGYVLKLFCCQAVLSGSAAAAGSGCATTAPLFALFGQEVANFALCLGELVTAEADELAGLAEAFRQMVEIFFAAFYAGHDVLKALHGLGVSKFFLIHNILIYSTLLLNEPLRRRVSTVSPGFRQELSLTMWPSRSVML